MILISRPVFILFALLAAAAVLAMGIFGYLYFHPGLEVPAIEAKLSGERFLFAAVCVALLLLLIARRLWSSATRVNREIDRIIRSSSHISLAAQLKSERLGPIAGSLSRLYTRIAELNEKQSLKMSAQHSLISFLCSNIEAPLLVTDISGSILYVSTALEKKLDQSRSSLLGTSVETIAPNILVQSILNELPSRRSYAKEEKQDLSFTVFPIYNRLRQVDYLIFDLRGESPLALAGPQEGRARSGGGEEHAAEGEKLPAGRSRSQLLGRMFNRFGGGKE